MLSDDTMRAHVEIIKERIAMDALNVRASLSGGVLYGQPIDPDNIDMMLAAAYHMGYSEGLGLGREPLTNLQV